MAKIPYKRLVCYLENYRFLKRTLHSATVFQKRFIETETAAPTVSAEESSSFTLQYLMDSCGLPYETALSTAQKVQLGEKNSEKPESVITLLKSLEFSDEQIAKLIVKRPIVLLSKINNNLKPKLQYLMDNGFEGSLLPELIVFNPNILTRSLTAQIKPSIDFLKTYLETNDKVVAAVRRTSRLLTSDLKGTLQPNIEFLLSEGVHRCTISKLLMSQPRTILQNFDRMVYAVNTVKSLGYESSAPMFVRVVCVMVSMSDSTWKRKVELFKCFGWSDEEIMFAFKRDPSCFACSEEKMKSMMDFYVNTMKLEPSVIVTYPKLLVYSKETRILPRYNVIKVLQSKKLLKNRKVAWILTQSEKVFLDKYVNQHLDQVPRLMDLYRGIIKADKIDA